MIPIPSVIVEDIPANREVLKKLLEQECPQVQVLGEAETLEEAEALIKKVNPDLVFMDIEIKKATSFDLLEKLRNKGIIDFEIIFFTAHGSYEYATRAIEFSALEFLEKPIDPVKLGAAVQKAIDRLNQNQHSAQIDLLLETLRGANQKSKRIAFHLTRGIIEFVQVDHIVYLEAEGTISHIFIKDGTKLTAMKNLGHYSKLLLFDYNFISISNSLLINMDYVKRYNHSELTVTLTNGQHLFASRRGGQDFKRFLNDNKGKFGNIQKKKFQEWLKWIYQTIFD